MVYFAETILFCIFAATLNKRYSMIVGRKCLIREKVVTFRMVKLNLLLSIFCITK